MENTLSTVSAIICFNSGSAGDLLKALCLSQIDARYGFSLEPQGAILIENQYFKSVTEKIYHRHLDSKDIDLSRVSPVDNSHYYLDFYPDITKNLYYIDYPDSYDIKILETVKKKRYDDDWGRLLEKNLKHFPFLKRSRIKHEDIQKMFLVQWRKNLSGWRNNSLLQPINFLDFFESEKIQSVVEKIINRPLSKVEVFRSVYDAWFEKNIHLLEN